MKKLCLANLIKIVSFLTLLTLLLLTVSYMLAPKDNTKESGIQNPNAHGFYSERENSIDVVVIGNSDAYSGFSPMELWNACGYTSYVSAEGLQSPAASLAMFRRILSCQSPGVVILETDGFFTKTEVSKNLLDCFNAAMGEPFSVFRYHNRWKKVHPDEFFKKPYYTAHCTTKGQMLSSTVEPYSGGEYMVETDATAKLPIATVVAVDEIRSICEERGIQLLLVEMPSESSWNYKKHNAVAAFAEERELTFLDLNLCREEFDFDWETDSRDGGNHLNTSGAKKATLYLGEYLADACDLPDHRTDANFAPWNTDYQQYLVEAKLK